MYRLRDLPQFVGLRRSQIAELIKARQFPRPVALSDTGRAVAWLENDLIAWQTARIAARNAEDAGLRPSGALRPVTASTVNGPRDNDRFGDLISADAISQTPPELQAVAQPAPERERFSAFARAHGSRGVALRRDECGDCRINGSRGHVYAAPEGFQIFVMGWSANG